MAPGASVQLGGLVKEESVERGENPAVSYQVTDTSASAKVRYVGILPDLFREGQGVVTEGVFPRMRASLLPIRFWPSMMRITCRRKSLIRSRPRASGRMWIPRRASVFKRNRPRSRSKA
tara:strand:+ start:1943 stop:2299 length:357 start_codon:yes stop_codon:yes gene_type:complete